MQDNNNNLNKETREWLYKSLSDNGYDLGTYEDFDRHADDEDTRKWLYDAGVNSGLELGSYEDFAKGMTSSNTANHNRGEGSVARQVINEYDSSVAKENETRTPDNASRQISEETKRQIIANKPGMFRRDTRSLLDKGAGVRAGVAQTPPGQENWQEQSDRLNEDIIQRAGYVYGQNGTYIAKRNASSQLDSILTDVDTMEKGLREKAESRRGAHNGYAYATPEEARENNLLRSARSLLDDAKNVVEEAGKKGRTNFVSGLFRGMRDNLSIDDITLGIADAVNEGNLNKALQKYDRGETLTEAEEKLLEASAVHLAVQNYFGSSLGAGYKAGQTTAASLPFMLEFAVNPVARSGNAIAKGLLKFGMNRFGRAGSFASRVAGSTGAALGMTATTGTPQVAANTMERLNENYEYYIDGNGDLQLEKTGTAGTGEALGKSIASTALTNQSEMVLNAFRVFRPYLRRMNELMPGSVNTFMASVKNSRPGQLYREIKNNPTMRELARRTQFQGFPQEYMEEVYNNLASVPLGDMTMDDVLDLQNNIDIALGLAPTMLAFSMIGTGGMAAERYGNRRRMERIFGKMSADQRKKFEELQRLSRQNGNEDIKVFIRETVTDPTLTQEQKREEIEYAFALATDNAIHEVQEADTEDRIDAEAQDILAHSDPETGTYTECVRYVTNDVGERVEVPGHIVGHMGGRPLWKPEGADDTVEAVPLKDGEYDPASLQSMPVQEVIDETAQAIREDAEEQARREEEAVQRESIGDPVSGDTFTVGGITYEADKNDPDYGWMFNLYDAGGNLVGNRPIPEEEYRRLRLQEQREAYEANVRSVNEGNNGAENIPASSETLQAGTSVASALERIPKDEQGQPLYEQADPETAWDAIAEQTGGDEGITGEVVADLVEEQDKALKAAEKELKKVQEGKPQQKKGDAPLTMDERIAAKKAAKEQLSQAQANVEEAKKRLAIWKDIANTPTRRKQAALAEQSKAAEEAARLRRAEEEKLRAEREEAERIRREALNGVPDFVEDTPQDARARGYRRVNGNKVDRQQAIPARQGNEVQVKFDDNNIPTGHMALIDASQLQPSHTGGQRNPLHFIDEAQPKERNDEASVMSARKIAANIRPEEITSSVTAYTGAPTVNSRGEVIQGNNRSAALREMWAEHPEQASRYKQYLTDHAADFGLAPEDVEAMGQPVLVNMLDVADDEAITLGQFVAQDTESGGTERIKPKNIVQKMGGDMRSFANQLLASPNEEMSFAELVDHNGLGVLKWMQQKGYITPTQYKSALDSKGGLTAEAKNDLKGVMYQSIFQNRNTHLEEMFNALPAKAQKAILATAYRDYDSPNAERMIEEIQNSINAYYALSQDPAFANAKNYKEARIAVELWKRQLAFDDVTGESYLPAEKYSNFALLLATTYKGQTQTFIQNIFANIYDLVQGTQETTLFEEPDNTPRTLVDAINETLGNLREELLLNGNFTYNGQQRSNVLAGGSAAGQQGRQGGDGSAPAGGRDENKSEQDDDSTRTKSNERQLRNDGKRQNTLSEVSSAERTEMESRIIDWLSDENLSKASGKTRNEIFNEFGNDLEPIAYIPTQFIPLVDIGLTDPRIYCGKGYFIDHALRNHAGTDEQMSVENVDASKYLNIQSVLDNPDSIKETYVDGKRTVVFIKRIGRFFAELTQVEDNGRIVLHKSLFNQKKEPYAKLNDIRYKQASPEGGTSSISHADNAAPAISLQSRGDEKDDILQTAASKPHGNTSYSVRKDTDKSSVTQTIGEKIAQAEAETNTEPTEAQKEAGNYKKGHVRIGQFDITVENPKGSVRRGTDASGKAWEQTMQNTYGYIRGTEGVDGDHIDVFLTNDIDGWNGRRVYIVDQYNEDGTFDEHKVMLGFNDEAEAQDAYLSNYEKGWEFKHKLVMSSVNLPDFEKWINSSHRKTKPFAEYKKVKSEAVQNEQRPAVSQEMDGNGHPFVLASDGTSTFGNIREETGLPAAPIKLSEGFQSEDGKGYGLAHIEYRHGAQIRNAGFPSIERFVEDVAKNFTVIKRGNARSTNETYLLEVQDAHNNTLFVELSQDGSYWNVNSAGVFKKGYSKKKDIVWTVPALGSSTNADATEVHHGQSKGETVTSGDSSQTISSDDKDNNSSANNQADGGFISRPLSTIKADREKILKETVADMKDEYAASNLSKTDEEIRKDAEELVDYNEESDLYMEAWDRLENLAGSEYMDKLEADARKKGEDRLSLATMIDELGRKGNESSISATNQNVADGFANYINGIVVRDEKWPKSIRSNDTVERQQKGGKRGGSVKVAVAFNGDNLHLKATGTYGCMLVIPGARRYGADDIATRLGYADITTDMERLFSDAVRELYKANSLKIASMYNYRPLLRPLTTSQGRRQDDEGIADREKREQEETEKIKQQSGPVEKIKDVGEKIGGAKKDRFKEFVEKEKQIQQKPDSFMEELRKLPVSKIFNFNLEALRKDGLGNEAATLIDVIRRVIPSKPRTDWKLKRWVSDVFGLYRFCLTLATAEQGTFDNVLDRVTNVKQIGGMYRAQMALGGFDSGLDTGQATLEELSDSAGHYDKDGKWVSIKGQWHVSHAGRYGGIYPDYEKAKEALAKFAGENGKPKGKGSEVKFSVYSYKKSGESFITPKGKPDIVVESGFKSSKEALDYLNEHMDELQSKYRNMKESTSIGFAPNGERRGKDWRGGKDVTAEDFRNTFGFRGVEFGNWANQQERQLALNQAYDAFMDLSEATGISPRGLSLGGELGMAFGARGGGGAAAHYEPGKVVINLTKTQGAGSLAHEWWHAIDNYFSRRRGQALGYNTERSGYKLPVRGGRVEFESESERKEITDAFAALMKAINGSSYGERSNAYAGLKSSYWKEPTELGARAFAVWVERKLSEKGIVNNFLANNNVIGWESPELTQKYYPYPMESDFESLDTAFDGLFGAIEEKVDEGTGNTVLYREAENELSQVNERFNEELQQQINGTLPKGHVYQLGMPSSILQATGFPNLPIEMSSTRLAEKAAQRNHEFDLADVENLVEALNRPLAVFEYGDKSKAQNVIVEIERDGKKFVIGVSLNPLVGGKRMEVNSIRGIFPKDNAEWLNWISQGKMLYVNKEKIQDLIDKQRTNLADVDYLDLDSIAKVVENFENPNIEDENPREGAGVLSDDDLSLANDPVSKLFGKSTRTAAQRRAFAERERQRMTQRVQELAEKLHLDNVDIVTDASTLRGERAKAKGFFNPSTGRITIVIPNQTSVFDAEQTLLHEAVAHYGLRRLFGEHFDTFLDNVYANADESVRRQIADLAINKYGYNFRTATEEYLASLAERTDFENMNASWWSKIKDLFLQMLHKIGFEDFSGVTLSDNELRYILWRSYENLRAPGSRRSILGEAVDIAKQYELQVGNYAPAGTGVGQVADAASSVKAERIRKLRESKPVEITGNEIEPSDDLKQYKKNALEYGKKLRGEYTNKDTGETISLTGGNSRGGIREILQHDYKDVEHLQSIAAIPQIIENSIFIDELPNEDFEKYPGVDSFSYYVCGLKIGKEDYTVKAVIANQSNGERYYDHKLTHIEKGKLLSIIPTIQKAGMEGNSPLSGIKDKRLLSILQENGEESNENDTDVLFRGGDEEPAYRKSFIRDRYERRMKSGMYQTAEAFMDSMASLKEYMNMTLKAEGKKETFEDVPGYMNAYFGENALSSVNEKEVKAMQQMLFKPLKEAIAALAHNKVEYRELIDYMMAKHGLERNEYMASENARKDFEAYQQSTPNGKKTVNDFLAEYRGRDYAGLTALTGEGNVADAEIEAQRMVDEYEANHDTTDLWEKVNAANKATLSKTYESGLMSKETYERVRDMYNYYIPLRGFDKTVGEDVYAYFNHKESSFNSPIRKAEGRSSKADDPIANMESMAESAILQGNRNVLVKQRFLSFALNHPSDLVSVNALWLEYDAPSDEWKVVSPDIKPDDTPGEIETKMREFEDRMKQLSESDPDRYKRARDSKDIPYRVVQQRDLKEHQVLVKLKGKDYILTVNGNPRLAQALNGNTNPDNDASGSVGKIISYVGDVNRTLATAYTQWSPDFVGGNAARDALYSNIMAWVKESPQYAFRFNKNYAKVNPVVMKSLFAKYRKGELNMQSERERLFKEFMDNGGETGYARLLDVDKHRKQIERFLKAANNKIPMTDIREAMGEWIGEIGRSIETQSRFAAYMTSRQRGRDVARSIWDAKEISVNFNKKGAGDKLLGATGQTLFGNIAAFSSGLGRASFVFWNAALQGTFGNFLKNAKKHPVKAMTATASMFGLGLLISALGAAGDDGDDDNYYNMPDYIRRTNLLIKGTGKSWLRVPLPIEYRAIYGMGELLGSAYFQGEKIDTDEFIGQFTQLLPVDIMAGQVEGDFNFWKPFVPSSVRPIVDVMTNTSWTGIPIYKDTPYNKLRPEWTKVYKSANPYLTDLSAALSDATGGDKALPGVIDFNPSAAEYLMRGYFGGLFTLPNQLMKLTETAIGERDFEWRDVPVVNRFVASGDERTRYGAINDLYYSYGDIHDRVQTQVRVYSDEIARGNMEYLEKYDELQNTDDFKIYRVFKEGNKRVRRLNEAAKKLPEWEKEKYDELERKAVGVKKDVIQQVRGILRK